MSYLYVILQQFIQQGYLNTHHRNITQARGGGKDQRGVLPYIPLVELTCIHFSICKLKKEKCQDKRSDLTPTSASLQYIMIMMPKTLEVHPYEALCLLGKMNGKIIDLWQNEH